jgi:RNA-splicing ligase RtcB
MIEVKGKYNHARCYVAALSEDAATQIRQVCDQEVFQDSNICIMPDVHVGKGCTIGTTMTITDKIVPGMVGVDIGCGMETIRLHERELDFAHLDHSIHLGIPSGFAVRENPHKLAEQIDLAKLRCVRHVNLNRAYKSIGTLGGGNHFIEVDQDEDGALYLVVHSGSRHLGNEVAKYYQNEGYQALCGHDKVHINDVIAQLKAAGRNREIQRTIQTLKNQTVLPVPQDLAYVEGSLFDDYLHDMKLIQQFAVINRHAMMAEISAQMRLTITDSFTTIHNYIDTEAMILRKGAVSARLGEKLLIPLNMRDGSLICVGKGNPEWNFSAPHGAGRVLSRSAAFKQLTMGEYEDQMSQVYSSSVVPDTLDESPMAYKPMDEIIGQIKPTAEIVNRIIPKYNFKAAENVRFH